MSASHGIRASIVVMGVSGVGKSTVAALLSERTGLPYVDADDLHGEANVAKMSAGIPLTDEDRWPWLARVGTQLAERSPVIVACSALRRVYRDALREHAPETTFVLLSASAEQIEAQVSARDGHFMPPSLLASQLATLEPLDDDERGLTIEVDGAPDVLVDRILRQHVDSQLSA